MKNSQRKHARYTNFFNHIFPTWENLVLDEHTIVHGNYYWDGNSGEWEEIPDWSDCMIIPEQIFCGK